MLVPSHDCIEVQKLSLQNMNLNSDLEKAHEELASTSVKLKVLESTLLTKSESKRIEDEILKLQAENRILRQKNAELSHNCSLHFNKDTEVKNINEMENVESCELTRRNRNDLSLNVNNDLKARRLIQGCHLEEEFCLKEPPSSELWSCDTVAAPNNDSTCGSSVPSLVSHWFPLWSDKDFTIGNFLSIPSLRSHYVRLPDPGKAFTSLEHVEYEFRELLRAKRQGQDCKLS